MLHLHFLEACIGAFDLWPAYLLELLLCEEPIPQNIHNVAAFFYGHDVPLGVASRVYAICNTHKETAHLIPYTMGDTIVPFIRVVILRIWLSIIMYHTVY